MRFIEPVSYAILAFLLGAATLLLSMDALQTNLPPCPTEDSINCVWDASARGNGKGASFMDILGYRVRLL